MERKYLFFGLAAALMAIGGPVKITVVEPYETLKTGASASALSTNVHVDVTGNLPVMGVIDINTSAAVWTVNKTAHEITIKQGGFYDISGSIDLYDQADSVQLNCAVEVWIEKNGAKISPYYRSNYLTRTRVQNKTSISIPSTVFVFSLGDVIRFRTRAVSPGDDCTLRVQTTNSYIQLKKYG